MTLPPPAADARPARPLRWPVAGPSALALGAVTGLGFQPVGWWWATIIGFAGFVLLLRGAAARRGFGLGYCYGLGYFGLTVWWVANFGWWAPVLLIAFLACWAGLAGWVTGWTTSRGPATVAAAWFLVAACAWTGSEWLAQRVPFGGFCWSRFVYTTADQPLGGWLPVIGAGGVSFLVALTGAALAWLAASTTWRRRLPPLALAFALLLSGGLLRFWPAPANDDGQLRVAMIQGDVDSTADPFSMGYPRGVTAMHLGETIMALATWRTSGTPLPDMILWPENSTDTDPAYDMPTDNMVNDASLLAGLPMLIGVISLGPGDDERQTSALWWLPGQGPVARADKRNLAPFGEFVPFYQILSKVVPMTQRVGRQTVPGTGPGILPVQLGDGTPLTIGNVICYELAYDSTVYDTVRNGAQLITVQSSNVSFFGTWQPAQQFAITRVRAMELRRWVTVATTSSLSGLIDPRGQVIDVTDEATAAFRLYTVPLGSGVTPGVIIGPWLEGGVSALAGAGVLLGLITTLRRRLLARATRRAAEEQPTNS